MTRPLLLAALLCATPAAAEDFALPDPTMTPGAVDTTRDVFCSRPSRERRHLRPGVSAAIAGAYNVPPGDIGVRYQLDHLVPLSISGASDTQNLWPQPMAQAYVKDRLDAKMKPLVCAGKLTLREAVEEISHDWTESYIKRIGPLPPLR